MSAPVTFYKKVAASDMKLAATWWRRGESNSCPKTNSYDFLRVQVLFRFHPARHRTEAAAGSSFSESHGQREKHRRLTFTT